MSRRKTTSPVLAFRANRDGQQPPCSSQSAFDAKWRERPSPPDRDGLQELRRDIDDSRDGEYLSLMRRALAFAVIEGPFLVVTPAGSGQWNVYRSDGPGPFGAAYSTAGSRVLDWLVERGTVIVVINGPTCRLWSTDHALPQ